MSYNGGGSDAAYGVAADNEGYVYVTGWSSLGDYDSYTIKYNATTGAEVWSRAYDVNSNADMSYANAVDNLGGLYVTGRSDSSFHTIKINTSTGDEIWNASYDTSATYYLAIGIDYSISGDVYIVGRVDNISFDYLTIKYNATTGEQKWAELNAHYGYDSAFDIAADNLDNIYVTGFTTYPHLSYSTVEEKYYTIKYSDKLRIAGQPEGVLVNASTLNSSYTSPGEVWTCSVKAYDGFNYSDYLMSNTLEILNRVPSDPSVAINSSEGNNETIEDLLCWAESTELDGQSIDYSGFWYKNGEIQYDSWRHTFTGANYEYGNGVDIDSSNNVIVFGGTDSFGAGDDDGLVVKYSPDGTQIWNRTLGSALHDGFSGGTVDNEDNIIAVGAASASGLIDYFWLAKYSPNGTLLLNFTITGNDTDRGHDAVVDSDNNIIVAGETGTFSAGYQDWWVLKYYPNGTQIWNITEGGPASDTLDGVALDSEGNIIAAGATGSFGANNTLDAWTIKYYPNGTHIWNRTFDLGANSEAAYDVAVDSNDNIVIVGKYDDAGTGIDALVVKYDKDGNEIWNITIPGGGIVRYLDGVEIDSQDNIIAAGIGYAGWYLGYWTTKIDSNGTVLWNMTDDCGYNSWCGAYDMALDPYDNIILTGAADIPATGGEGALTIKYQGFNLSNQASGQMVNAGTLNSSETSTGDNWSCKVKAYDGMGHSNYTMSENLSILQAAEVFNASFVSPATNINVTYGELFNITVQVGCAGTSNCTDVIATLDPIWVPSGDIYNALAIDLTPQTCSGVWGFDCGIGCGTGEPGDNTFDSCDVCNGANTDEHVDNVYLNATTVTPGTTLNVTCEYDPWGTGTEEYIWYYDNQSWYKLYEGNAPGAAIHSVSVLFTANSSEGMHAVRCIVDYNGEGLSSCESGSYVDHDDVTFTVEAAAVGDNVYINSIETIPATVYKTDSVQCLANVTANNTVSAVYFNVTYPNSTTVVLGNGTQSGDNWTSSSFIPDEIGSYTCNVFAIDNESINATDSLGFTAYSTARILGLSTSPSPVYKTDSVSCIANTTTHNSEMSAVYFNITYPDNTTTELGNGSRAGDIWTSSFDADQVGSYNCTAKAVDNTSSEDSDSYVFNVVTYSITNITPQAIINALTNLSLDDDDVVEIGLPFEFEFYGTNYTSAWFESNGWVGFGTGGIYWTGWADPYRGIYFYDEDLQPAFGGGCGSTLYDNTTYTDRVIFQWDEVCEYGETDIKHSGEIIIYEDGTIEIINDYHNATSGEQGVHNGSTEYTQTSVGESDYRFTVGTPVPPSPITINSINISPSQIAGGTNVTCSANVTSPSTSISAVYFNITLPDLSVLELGNGTQSGDLWNVSFNASQLGDYTCFAKAVDENNDSQTDTAQFTAGTKGVVPMNSGTPFYTIHQNPTNGTYTDCLRSIAPGDYCNVTWTLNATGEIGTEWIFFAFFNGSYTETNRINLTITEPLVDAEAPNVTLITPTNGSTYMSSSNVVFTYNVSDNVAIANCSITIDGTTRSTDTAVENNAYNSFTVGLSNSNYSWNVTCTDTSANSTTSETFFFALNYTAPPPSTGGGGGGGGAADQCTSGEIGCSDSITRAVCQYNLSRGIWQWAYQSCENGCEAGNCKEECDENWFCTTWGECSAEGTQARECTDLAICDTYDYMPPIQKKCVPKDALQPIETPYAPIKLRPSMPGAGLLLLIYIIALLSMFMVVSYVGFYVFDVKLRREYIEIASWLVMIGTPLAIYYSVTAGDYIIPVYVALGITTIALSILFTVQPWAPLRLPELKQFDKIIEMKSESVEEQMSKLKNRVEKEHKDFFKEFSKYEKELKEGKAAEKDAKK